MLEVSLDCPQLLFSHLLVELLQQRDVGLKVLVVVADIDEGSEQVWRENNFEGLPVLLDGVEETKAAQAVHLQLVLHFQVLTRVVRYVDLLRLLVKRGTVVHQQLANYVSSMKPDLNVIGIVQGQVSQRCED